MSCLSLIGGIRSFREMALKWSTRVCGAKINNASLLPIVSFFFWNFRPPALLEITGILGCLIGQKILRTTAGTHHLHRRCYGCDMDRQHPRLRIWLHRFRLHRFRDLKSFAQPQKAEERVQHEMLAPSKTPQLNLDSLATTGSKEAKIFFPPNSLKSLGSCP